MRILALIIWFAFAVVVALLIVHCDVGYAGTLQGFEDAVRANAKAHRIHVAECRALVDDDARRLCAAIEDARDRKALANAQASWRETSQAYHEASQVAADADARVARERAAAREPPRRK